MILSMTGYGKARAAEADVAVAAEVRSVNNRGREVRFRLPQELLGAEEDLRQLVQARVARGRVDVTLAWDGAPPQASHVALNMAAATTMVEAWRTLKARFELSDWPSTEALLRLPGVLEPVAGTETDVAALTRVAGRALELALEAHHAAREREGRKLGEDLAQRAGLIASLVAEIEQRVAGAPEKLAADLRARVATLLGGVALDEQRLYQEIALLAQRADVTEEQVRLRAHLARLDALFAPGATEIGRTLEFLVQEIRREVSTLTAKTSDPEIDARSLAIRTELERIREQAANLE